MTKLRDGVLCCMLVLFSAPEQGAKASAQVFALNNVGVKQLFKNQFDGAIQTFEECLKREPSCAVARTNLAIAHNNLGLQLSTTSMKQALSEFYKSYYFDQNETTKKNIDSCLISLKSPANTVSDRLNLASAAESTNEIMVQFVELEFAYRLKNDPSIKLKLDKLKQRIKSETKLISPSLAPSGIKVGTEAAAGAGKQGQSDPGHHDAEVTKSSSTSNNEYYSPELKLYMKILEPRIKKFWEPIYTKEIKANTKVVCRFKVRPDGSLQDPVVTQGSGSSQLDNSAIAALKAAVPYPPLPKAELKPVDIEFNFDYNLAQGMHPDSAVKPLGSPSTALKSELGLGTKAPLSASVPAESTTGNITLDIEKAESEGRKKWSDKDYEGARKCYQKAFDLAQGQSDELKKITECVCLHSAVYQINCGDALKLYQDNLAMVHQHADFANAQQFFFEYAGDLKNAKHFPEALAAYQDAYETYKKDPKLKPERAKSYLDGYQGFLVFQQKTSEAEALKKWMNEQTWK